MGKGRIEEGERAQWGEDEVRMEGRGQWEDNEGWMRQWKGERTAGGKRRVVRGREGEENESRREYWGEGSGREGDDSGRKENNVRENIWFIIPMCTRKL